MPRIITGTGRYLPGAPIPNAQLLDWVEDFDAERAGVDLDSWLRAHYGISSRHWAAEQESTGDLGLEACKRALEDARLEARDVDLIVLATCTSDAVTPNSAARVQAGLPGCKALFLQLQDGCAGFLNALLVADSMMANLAYRRVLVVAAEKTMEIVDRSKFRMVGLFGDGAGAVVLEELAAPGGYGFRSFYGGSDGSLGDAVRVPAGGSRRRITAERLRAGEHYLVTDFKRIYPFAVRTFCLCFHEVLKRAGLKPEDIDWVLPHHAALNIIQEAVAQAEIDPGRLALSIEHAGNTSSASVPVSLAELRARDGLQDRQTLALLALGGGMSWASAVYVWLDPAIGRQAR